MDDINCLLRFTKCVQLFVWIWILSKVSANGLDCPAGQWLESSGQCKPCGKCLNGAQCDNTGACPGGDCELWYVPQPYCYELIPVDEPYLSLSHIQGGPTITFLGTTEAEIKFEEISNVPEDLRRYYAYKIQYRISGDLWTETDTDIPVHGGEVTRDIYNLRPNTRYDFRVALYRVLHNRHYSLISFSSYSTGSTICAAPGRPKVTEMQHLQNSIRFNWKPFESNCNFISQAKMEYSKIGSDDYTSVPLSTGSVTSGTVSNLEYMAAYQFRIVITNDALLESVGELGVTVYIEPMEGVVEDMGKSGTNKTQPLNGTTVSVAEHKTIVLALILVLVVACVAAISAIVFALLFIRGKRRNTTTSAQVHYEKDAGYERPTLSTRQGNLPDIPKEETYESLSYDNGQEKAPLSPSNDVGDLNADDLRSSYLTPGSGCYIDVVDVNMTSPLGNGRSERNRVTSDASQKSIGYLKPVCH